MKHTLALFAALALSLPALAQGDRTPPTPAEMAQHHISHLTTMLSLTAEQAEQATTLFTAEATSEQSMRATERSAHEALETAIKNNDTATIQSTAATLGQLNGQMTALHATTQAKFYATLTADQKTRYAEMEHDHHHRGPGGPPPPASE